MLVKEIMTKDVVKIDMDKSVYEASLTYRQLKVGSLLVTKDNHVVGIITERDIIERTICEKQDPGKTLVSEIMTKNPKSIHPLEKVETALNIMLKDNIKKLPVMVDHDIVGIITITDISKSRPELSKRFMNSWVRPSWND